MRLINLALLACVASLAACNSEKTSKESSAQNGGDSSETAYVVKTVSYKDSVTYSGNKAVASCTLGYLTSEAKDNKLVESVDAWIRDMLKGTDKSVAVGEPLAKLAVKDALEESSGDLKEWSDMIAKDGDTSYPPMTYEFDYKVEPLAMAPGYVTMLYTSYVFTGGAHGGAAAIGQTFASDSGKALDMDMFKEGTTADVLKLVEKGLMEQYFEVKTPQEFHEQLLLNNNELTFPANAPYFEEDGVCFLYQQYEIAPYAAGMPQCVIPFDTLKPYFTDSTLKILGMN